MGEANQACFGGGIVRTDDPAHVGCGRGDVDDTSPTGSAHCWQHGLRYKECRLQIYIDNLVPVGLRNLVQPLDARDPGVITHPSAM